jgi:hypothetical protein
VPMESQIILDAQVPWVAAGRRLRATDFARYFRILSMAECEVRKSPLASASWCYSPDDWKRWRDAGRLLREYEIAMLIQFTALAEEGIAALGSDDPRELGWARRQVFMRYAEDESVAAPWEHFGRGRPRMEDESVDA